MSSSKEKASVVNVSSGDGHTPGPSLPLLLESAIATQALLQAMKAADLEVRPSLAFAILRARDAAHAAIQSATRTA